MSFDAARARSQVGRLLLAVVLVCLATSAARADDAVEEDTPRALTCQAILDAFAGADEDALRSLLAPRDVQLTLPILEEERQRAVDGRFSADQAAVVLASRLARDLPPAAPDLGPDALTSADGAMSARCPVFDPTEGSVFLVIHYAIDASAPTASARVKPRTGRIYLDLHHDEAAARWQVRAVRELR